jgi:hypothetical protein
MSSSPHGKRLVVAGAACSGVVLAAGLIALLSSRGVIIASVLLTAAAIIAAGGLAAARDPSRRVNIGIWLPIAAALPLFGVFYAIGLFIFEHLGQTYAGALLIAVAVIVAVASAFAASNRHTEARR